MTIVALSDGNGIPEREPRSAILVSAVLYEGRTLHTVRIRNVSSRGALVEGATLPLLDARVTLVRGEATATGAVVWVRNGKCGLSFDCHVAPSAWKMHSQTGQSQVDAQIAHVRSGRPDLEAVASVPADLQARIAEEIGAVGRQLGNCLDVFAAYAPFVVRHGKTLQELEVAAQVLGHLGSLLQTNDVEGSLRNLGMADLKRRLIR